MHRADGYLPRRAADMVVEALGDTRVVILNGARQTGKSTLAELCLRDHPAGVRRYLDDPRTRASAAADPVAFLDAPGAMLIDEVQRVPELWLTIKHIVDRDPRPGRFLLTGSARLLGLSQLPDSLPGRSETIELFPLSQGEITGKPDGFVDAAFEHGSRLRAVSSTLRRRDYLALAARGGYPEAVRRETPRRRAQFFRSYLDDIMSRDVHQVADIQRISDMRRLIGTLAAQSGGLLNYSRLSSDLALPASTVRDYVGLLELIYLIRLIPAWSANATTRAVATPKLVFNDVGLAGHLVSGVNNDATTGGLVETFVIGELARQITWSQTMPRLHHYRDRDGYEVDAVLEDNAGLVVAIEVKAAETVRTDDFRSIRVLQRRLGDRFRAGFVLYCGDQQLPFGENLACLPISALWTTRPE
ncbi:ATP-binding protein [Amycolatopsis sp. WAC 01376]|uniref:ATP-binding protein n=1 Tax=Amycolatopsis sp. WAC 01376 TaxID=2203195 RepID=UPI001F1EE012|nr:ATP-binding protein [Amycolatopsis sp. WAC 01376]